MTCAEQKFRRSIPNGDDNLKPQNSIIEDRNVMKSGHTLSEVYSDCRGSWYNLAKPRSPILTCPVAVTRIFAGFKSRCMIQLSCKYATPFSNCHNSDFRTAVGREVRVEE